MLYDGAQVGDVVKVEAEFHVDGIEVTEVFAPKQKKQRSDLLELKARPLRDDELVTTQRVSRDGRRGGRRNDRDGRRSERRDGGGGGRGGNRGPRAETQPQRPKPKRLSPKRVHRNALLAEVAEEHRPIVEQVMADGMPGVRSAIEKQNAEAKEAGKPEVDAAPILAIAEKNLQKARLAEWRDRADSALEWAEKLDLRDLRSVVVAGNDIARDPESREVADKLKAALDARVESDHATWLADLDTAVTEGRVVRALRLSSRPVKAGAPLPPELASTLAAQASEALAGDVGQERWATVLNALAFSPVRSAVTPSGVPEQPKAELIEAVKSLADRVPTIAALFGIDPADVPRSARRHRSSRDRRKGRGGAQRQGEEASAGKRGGKPRSDRPHPGSQPKADDKASAEEASATDAVTPEAAAPEAPAVETPATEAPATEAPAPEAAAPETPAVETPAPEAPAPEASTPEAPAAETLAPEASGSETLVAEAPAGENGVRTSVEQS